MHTEAWLGGGVWQQHARGSLVVYIDAILLQLTSALLVVTSALLVVTSATLVVTSALLVNWLLRPFWAVKSLKNIDHFTR